MPVRMYVLLITFSLLGGAFPAKSQQPLVGCIQGAITNRHGAPIPYADLTAANIDAVEPESHLRSASTDQQGIYQFVDVPEGRYSIVVKKSGYRDYTVPLVTVYPGEKVKMPEIKMSPVSTSAGSGDSTNHIRDKAAIRQSDLAQKTRQSSAAVTYGIRLASQADALT
jgi:hypothetical protein